jgi:hypothetical protein
LDVLNKKQSIFYFLGSSIIVSSFKGIPDLITYMGFGNSKTVLYIILTPKEVL